MAHGGEPSSEDESAAGGSGQSNLADTNGDKSGEQNLSQGATSTSECLDEDKTDACDTDSEQNTAGTVNSPLSGHGKINWSRFKVEAERLKTFRNWSVPFMDKEQLATVGFVYYWGDDVVKCVFCHTEIGHFTKGDDPFEEHKKWAPNCRFVNGYDVGNIPIDEAKLPVKPLKKCSYDTCGLFGLNVLPTGNRSSLAPHDDLSQTMEKFGILCSSKPSYPEYVTNDARLKTFASWPIAMKQTPEKLSEAGFFYTGNGDQTMCFHCGKGLGYWEEYDDPWIQHAVWFPRCGFLVMSKGKAFVDHVQQNKQKLSTAEGQAELAKETSFGTNRKTEEVPKFQEKGNVHLCKICGEKARAMVFLPCGHVIACMECGPEHSICPDCKVEISAKMKAHIA